MKWSEQAALTGAKVTVDLDVLVRADLINFLIEESEVRGATILCQSSLITRGT